MKLESYSKKTEQVDEYEKFNHSYLEDYNHGDYEEQIAELESIPKEVDDAIMKALETSKNKMHENVNKNADELIDEHRAKREERKKELLAMKKGLEETKYGYEGVSYGGEAFNIGNQNDDDFDAAMSEFESIMDRANKLF